MQKYVYRCSKQKHNFGWYVSIEPLDIRRYFSDRSYGGKSDAFLAALEYRNSVLEKHRLSIADRVIYTRARPNNKTGRLGVCKYDRYYYAYFPVEKNRTLTKKFSISKYGEDEAFSLAKAWREKLEKAVYGTISAQSR